MTPDELLMPRFKVIADYPNSKFTIGEIRKPRLKIHELQYESFPHLFRKLEWWQEREVKDLPEFLKFVSEKGEVEVVKKVTKYKLEFAWNHPAFYDGTIEKKGKFKGTLEPFPLSNYLPATESEYNEYKSKTT